MYMEKVPIKSMEKVLRSQIPNLQVARSQESRSHGVTESQNYVLKVASVRRF